MELNKEIRERLVNIFYNLNAELTLLLESITNEEQLDATVEYLAIHYPAATPSPYDVTCLKQSIQKWGGLLEFQFSDDFKSKFPLIAKKLESSDGNMLIFLKTVDLLRANLNSLARIIEPIIKAHEIEGKELYEIKAGPTRASILRMVASSPQPCVQAFKSAFFPNLNNSGEMNEKVYFDWRSPVL